MAKSISRAIFWQTISRFLAQGISIITTPIFTRLLTTSDYGKFSTYNAWVLIIGIVVGLQTQGSIANARIKYSENEYRKYISSIFSISLLTYIFFILLSFLLRNQFALLFSVDDQLVPVMFINAFFSFCVSFYSQILMQDRNVEKNAVISLIIASATMVISILLVKIMLTNKYVGRIYGTLIPLVVVGIFEIFIIYKSGRTLYNQSYWLFCLSLTLPLIFHGLSGLILSQSDRIMLTKMFNEEETGIYGVAYSMGAIIDVIWNSFNTAWVPFYYDYKKNNDNINVRDKSWNYMIVFSVITIGFILCSPEVFKLMVAKVYWERGIFLLPLISVAYYFNFLYSFLVNFEFYHKKTKLISMGTVLSAGINLILNYILIPRYVGVGAAIATIVSYLFLFLFHYCIANYVMIEKCEYRFLFFLKGLIPVLISSVTYYFMLNLWIPRWILASLLGGYLLQRFIKNKSII